MADRDLDDLASETLQALRAAGLTVATVESCTGGGIAAALTEIAGSSDVVDRGFVTYSNEAKMELVGVSEALLTAHGAVSAEVVAAMAEGGLERSMAGVAVSVSGVAGPGGGTETKPVGLVFLGLAMSGHETRTERHIFPGDRKAVRTATVVRALEILRESAGQRQPAEGAGKS